MSIAAAASQRLRVKVRTSARTGVRMGPRSLSIPCRRDPGSRGVTEPRFISPFESGARQAKYGSTIQVEDVDG
jgi:hypothetical protein